MAAVQEKPSTKLASGWKGVLAKFPQVQLDQGSVRGYPVSSCSYGNTKFWPMLDTISVLAMIGGFLVCRFDSPGLPLPLPDFFLSKI